MTSKLTSEQKYWHEISFMLISSAFQDNMKEIYREADIRVTE